MKKITACVVLVGLIVLSGCSGDSKNAPPVPTPATATWSITSLTTSSATAQVDSAILVTATVSRDGSTAPDGTAVEFLATGGYFVSSALTSAEVATEGGSAVVQFWAEDAGSYTVQARVGDAIRQVTVSYFHPSQSDALQIYSISPSEGPLTGGQLAYLTGKNIEAPVDVFFVVNGADFQAVTIDVSTTGEAVTVTTPEITGVDLAQEWTADVRVETRAGLGLGDGETFTFAGAYRFGPAISDPIIYILQPGHGSARGGETINIIGQNFIEPVRVTLGTLEVGEETVSPDGQLISFLTPQYSVTPLTEDVVVDVTVFSESGTAREKSVTKTGAFQFDAEVLTPVVTGIDPVGGPLDGGTVVTLFGSGFSIPVQVMFGDREADVTDVREDRIVCVSPDYSTVSATVPVTVEVTVSNLESGLTSSPVSFTYGENLYITGNGPGEGYVGDVVTIYGSGFVDPLMVGFAEELALEPIAVSGTEVVARFPEAEYSCEDRSGAFQITLVESGLSASGGNFLLRGEQPEIYYTSPTVVDESSAPWMITIYGSRFTDPTVVEINGYRIPSSSITVVDSGTITVINVPGPDILGLEFDTVTCVDGSGDEGERFVQTSAPISVTNFPMNCTTVLDDALAINPADTTCRVEVTTTGPVISVTPASFDFGTVIGGFAYTTNVVIANTGDEDLNITNLTFANGSNYSLNPNPMPIAAIAPGASTVITIQFDAPGAAGNYTDTLIIEHNAPGSPTQFPLSGDV